MKPLGLTPMLEVVRPDRVQDAVWDAVETAIEAGWTVDQFRSEARDCWQEKLRRKTEEDLKRWCKP